MQIPDLTEKVTGFRGWELSKRHLPQLTGAIHRPWVPGVNTAVCIFQNGPMLFDEIQSAVNHKAPGYDCSCGNYNLHGPQEIYLWLNAPIIGITLSWGDIEVDPTWFRAEHTEIAALAIHPQLNRNMRGWRSAKRLLPKIASYYKVPMIKGTQLEALAPMLGNAIPEDLIPSKFNW